MYPSIDISCDTFIYNPNPNTNPNPNPNYIHETSPFLFSHFPSPFLDDYTDFLPPPHHHIFNTTNYNDINISPNIKMATPSQPSSSLSPPPPPPPPLKKMRTDRHSKIFTAQGVRARRMRLPLRIARRFFDLQDILGFDKASKTIEWLLAKSKGAIKELAKNIPSSTSGKGDCGAFSDSSEGEKNKRKLVKAKETRDKARARARERTRKKMMMRSVEKMGQLRSSTSSNPNSSFDSGSPHQSTLNKQFSNVGIDGDLSNPIFDHENIIIGGDNNNFLEFLENWDIVENEMIGY